MLGLAARCGADYCLDMPKYRCAICEKDVSYAGRVPDCYPFCSARCKLVDLGRWLGEQYSINRDLTPEELAEREFDRGESRGWSAD